MRPPPNASRSSRSSRRENRAKRLRYIKSTLAMIIDRDSSDGVTADVAVAFEVVHENQASSSPCAPKTRAHCSAASLLPASLVDAGRLGLTQQCQQRSLLGKSLDLWFVPFGGTWRWSQADVTFARASHSI